MRQCVGERARRKVHVCEFLRHRDRERERQPASCVFDLFLVFLLFVSIVFFDLKSGWNFFSQVAIRIFLFRGEDNFTPNTFAIAPIRSVPIRIKEKSVEGNPLSSSLLLSLQTLQSLWSLSSLWSLPSLSSSMSSLLWQKTDHSSWRTTCVSYIGRLSKELVERNQRCVKS